jgi:ligand-binding SRPBCC domain-containing protein
MFVFLPLLCRGSGRGYPSGSGGSFLFLRLMPTITLTTHINAPIQICFDLSRSIDLHMISTKETGERVVAGRTTGLIELNERVTWRAKHLGVWQTLTSKITEFSRPYHFVDEMEKGAFKSFRHEHHFQEYEGGTLMKDVFTFESPLGPLGVLFNTLFLIRYMTCFLSERNAVIKEYAESDKSLRLLEHGIM